MIQYDNSWYLLSKSSDTKGLHAIIEEPTDAALVLEALKIEEERRAMLRARSIEKHQIIDK